MKRFLSSFALLISLTTGTISAQAALNDAFLFAGSSNLAYNNFHGLNSQIDFKGFETNINGVNQGFTNISWSATWYGCSTDPEFRATTVDTANSPVGSALADEAAIDAYLASHNCTALPLSGSKDSTATSSNSFWARYSFAEYDASGKAFATAKIRAAATGETTGFAVLPGAVRPMNTTLPTLSISGTTINSQQGVYSGDYTTLSHYYYLCDSALQAQTDSSYYPFELALTAANCQRAVDANQANPSDLEDLYVYVGNTIAPVNPNGKYLHLISGVEGVVFAWRAGTLVNLAAPAPTPYVGPVLQGFSTKILNPCKPTLVIISGSQLSGLSGQVAGVDVKVVSSTDSELRIEVPAGLRPGKGVDLVISSSYGSLTHQDAFDIPSSVCAQTLSTRSWTKLQSDGKTVKIYTKNPLGAGKVQFFKNGKEIAWVNASDQSDPKLSSALDASYFVRSVDLTAGKNRFEIKVDGLLVWKATYVPKG